MVKNRKRMIIILIAVFIIIVGILGRSTSNNVMKINISDVKIKNVDSSGLDYGDYTIDEQLKKTILANSDEYRYIFYNFDADNISKNAKIIFVDLQPIFSSAMAKNVVYYDRANDVPTNTVLNLYPQKSKTYSREVLVKRNGLTDEELIKLAQGDKFKVSYSTDRWYSLFGIIPNKKVAMFEK